MNSVKVDKRLLMPVLAGFFIMGFCDIVAPLTGNIIVNDFPSDSNVYYLPSMVFLWFLLLSTPIAAFMNRHGRKITALIGYLLTCVGLIIPYLSGESYSLGWLFAGFGVLGLGNTFVQVAVNPMLATIVPGERMTSYLTVGQIFRNTALMLVGPLVTLLMAFTDNWLNVLPVYALLTVVGGVWLQLTSVPEPRSEARTAGLVDCFRLLRNSRVLISAVGIATFIAADISINFVAGNLIDTSSSILTSTGFYACRIVGTLVGAWVLVHYSDVKYLRWNMGVALLLCLLLILVQTPLLVYVVMGVLGFVMSCVFATFYAVATKAVPEQANGVAGLMILAISGGAVACPASGLLIEWTGVNACGLLFPVACLCYMFWAALKLGFDNNK